MTSKIRKIIAIGGGEIGRPGTQIETEAIDKEIISLSGKSHPKLLFLPTASKDNADYIQVVENYFGARPFSGHLFLFISRSRNSCKCLYYDGTGLVIVSKRLERGTFSKINPFYKKEIILTQAEFSLFFEGANLEKRFIESPIELKKYQKNNAKNDENKLQFSVG